jgi:hypothetical protein
MTRPELDELSRTRFTAPAGPKPLAFVRTSPHVEADTAKSANICGLVRRFPSHPELGSFNGDLVAEVGELFERASFDPFGVVSGVVVQAEVLIEGPGSAHLPDDH